ncbi:uncharacterized protein LOC128239289 isoform X2 [Mya arenaria]|uniref:uncharacterized protein LOC128239289 isoform X2 n=1 Tax=Mya arenaria TaxID=6604 RepID=UPI0022E3F774|nr:uncharacterized protein LOC128239289 isoform X2 [Mya arenaria]
MMQDGGGIHGPDAVISLVDYALTEFGHGERVTTLHADNCGGQNKNRYLLAGHARCIIDAGFGRIKALYRRTDCETLSDLENVVASSSTTNEAVLYKKPDGTSRFEWREWKTFLGEQFRALKGIRSYQQFRFTSESPGIIFLKKGEDNEETSYCVFRGGNVLRSRPQEVQAAGLSRERQAYLATHVRKYLRAKNKDTTCPLSEE